MPLKEFQSEEIFCGSAVHQVFHDRAVDCFVRQLRAFSLRHMYQHRTLFNLVEDFIAFLQAEGVVPFAEIHSGRKETAHSIFFKHNCISLSCDGFFQLSQLGVISFEQIVDIPPHDLHIDLAYLFSDRWRVVFKKGHQAGIPLKISLLDHTNIGFRLPQLANFTQKVFSDLGDGFRFEFVELRGNGPPCLGLRGGRAKGLVAAFALAARKVLDFVIQLCDKLQIGLIYLARADHFSQFWGHHNVLQEFAQLFFGSTPVPQLDVHENGLVLEVFDFIRDSPQVSLETQQHFLHSCQGCITCSNLMVQFHQVIRLRNIFSYTCKFNIPEL
mmetsp:Transcript_24816/g.32422  ORF Transcript_24816/g.32422 Transcript_24816/m.32422 type:complete len:328 (-) Transcript_24816:408-1391(-)